MTAEDIMERDYVCVTPDMPVREAAELMTKHDRLLLPVIENECGAAGVLMETDLLRVVLPRYLDSVASLRFLPDSCELFDVDVRLADLTVKDIVGDRRLHTVQHDAGAAEIAHVMLTKGLSSVAVEKDGRVVGIVTRGSLVRHIYHQTFCETKLED